MSLFQSLLAIPGTVAHVPQTLQINQQIGVMIWGQSNALGSTDGVTPTTSPVDLTAPLVGCNMYINATGNFNTLQYQVNSQGSAFNSDLTLGYNLYASLGRPVFLGMEAVNGAPLFNDLTHTNFSPDAVAPFRLIDDLLAVNVGLKNRCALYGKTAFIISIWIGGEADSQDDATVAAIRDNYEATKAYILANGGQIDAEIVSILNQNYANATATQIANVRSIMQGYCNQTATAYAMDMDLFPLRSDNIHFTGPGQEQIGEYCANDLILSTIFGLGIETYPGSYSTDAKTALKNYRSDLAAGYKDAIADFVDGCVTDGILDDILICQVRAMDAMTSAMVDLRGRKYGVNNGGTHDPGGGITYDGVDDYTDTGWQPDKDGGSLVTLNDSGWGFYVVDNLSTANRTLGGVSAGTDPVTILAQTGAASLAYNFSAASPGGAYGSEGVFADSSLYLCARAAASGANALRLYKNGVSVSTDTDASSSFNSTKPAEGARRTSSTAVSLFINAKIGLFIVYKHSTMNYTNLNSRISTLITDLAAL